MEHRLWCKGGELCDCFEIKEQTNRYIFEIESKFSIPDDVFEGLIKELLLSNPATANFKLVRALNLEGIASINFLKGEKYETKTNESGSKSEDQQSNEVKTQET